MIDCDENDDSDKGDGAAHEVDTAAEVAASCQERKYTDVDGLCL